MTFTEEMTAALDGAHRRIRRIAAGEGPYAGMLVTDGEAVAVWVDMESPSCALDWRFAGAEHVAAPLELARSLDGHGALLPWCSTRIAPFLSRRSRADVGLDAGEWVTLVASVLRGLREIAERADAELSGDWWLSYDGRPLCVPGGDRAALSGATDVLRRAGEDCADRALRRLLLGVADAVSETMPSAARTERWEQELLAFAAPRPLRTDVRAPELAREATAAAVVEGAAGAGRRRIRERRDVRWLWAERVAPLSALRAAASLWIGRWGTVRPASGRRERGGAGTAAPRRRRGLVLAGSGAAAVVVIAGLLLPGGDDARSGAAEAGRIAAAGSDVAHAPAGDAGGSEPGENEGESESAPEGPPSMPPATEDSDDPVIAAQAILRSLSACAAEEAPECPTALADDATVDLEAILQASAAVAPALVDDYGDMAVVRLGDATTGEQMLVLIRQDGKWLVRDAYDVADQPFE